MESHKNKLPSAWVSALPLAVLTLLLYVVIRCFGGDAINGGSQIALLSATSVCVMLSIGIYRCKWSVLEDAIIDNIRASASAIIILLLIGAIAGSWMVSGVVPTMIYYGLKILHPSFFLVASCVICAGVSLMTGSSWTTIATIGVALMGIGQAMGFPEGWIAGAIISGGLFRRQDFAALRYDGARFVHRRRADLHAYPLHALHDRSVVRRRAGGLRRRGTDAEPYRAARMPNFTPIRCAALSASRRGCCWCPWRRAC